MINVAEANQITINSAAKVRETKVFKAAMEKLEKAIREAASKGENEISYNVAFFDIIDFGQLNVEEHATQRDKVAIEMYMKELGYNFFYHSMGNPYTDKNWFTCRW